MDPEHPASGLCGLFIDNLWAQRPPTPEDLCAHCCVLAIAVAYPLVKTEPRPLDRAEPTGAAEEHACELTARIPAVIAGDARHREVESPTVRLRVAEALAVFAGGSAAETAAGLPVDAAAAATRAYYAPAPPSRDVLERVLAGLRKL